MFSANYMYNPNGYSSVSFCKDDLLDIFKDLDYYVAYYKNECGYLHLGVIKLDKLCPHCVNGEVKVKPKSLYSPMKECKHCHGTGLELLTKTEQDRIDSFLRKLWVEFYKG